MDLPARKRRRTSSPGRNDRSSSPLKQRPRRPSFASPTKASLARFNPSLLPRSASAGADNREVLLDRGKNARAFIFGETDELATGDFSIERNTEEQAATGAESRTNARDITPRPRNIRRVRDSVPLQDVREEEEELPATPSARDTEEQDTPRRGVLFSSPSKRPPRVKDHAKGSQLKPKQAAPRIRTSTPVEASPADERVILPEKQRRETPDPEIEQKIRERAKLQREVEKLEREVEWYSRLVEKCRHEVAPGSIAPSERKVLINYISKVSQTPEDEDEQSMPTSNLLCSFLPFSVHLVRPPRVEKMNEKPIPSHRPLELDDPLPYLQMFTPFSFTSEVTLPTDADVDPAIALIQQKHTIGIVGPAKLLIASLEATVDTLSHQVVKLELPKLSLWAERELGTFALRKAQEKDLSTVCWAIGSYWEIAKKRAEYRHKCEAAFAQLIPERTNDDTENISPATEKSLAKMSRQDLSRQLGREALELQDQHILLRITWRIGFDWTGEAESHIDVEPAFPRAWTEGDGQKSLSKIPETFQSLLQSKGAFQATKAIVALLFSDQ